MKIKVLVILTLSLLACFVSFSQTANTVSAKTLNATVSIYLRTARVDSFSNDPNMLSNSANILPTQAAVVAYVKNAGKTNVFAQNGLSALNDSTFIFGGRLLQNTTLSASTFSLTFDSLSNFSLKLLPSKSTALSTDSVLIKDASGKVWVLPVPSGSTGTVSGTANQVTVTPLGGNYTVSLPSTIHLSASLDVGSTSSIQWGDGGGISGTINGFLQATGDGIFLISNSGANGFGRLMFGGATSSFPSLVRNSAELDAKLADNSAFAAFQALSFIKSGGTSSQYLMADGSTSSGYTLPTATTSVLGGVKVDGTSITISGGVISSTESSSGLTRQNITSGTSATVTGGKYLVQFNFSTLQSSYTLTLPASPADQDVVEVQTGTTIPAGSVEIASFSVSANSGQTLNFSIPINTLTSGDNIKIRYNTTGTFWDRVY